jgi:prevent-host-death family protein
VDISIYDAKTQLSALVDRLADGEEIVITRHGRPVAKLVPAGNSGKERTLGLMRGKIKIAKDFDAALPSDVLALFEGT